MIQFFVNLEKKSTVHKGCDFHNKNKLAGILLLNCLIDEDISAFIYLLGVMSIFFTP